MTLDVRKLKSHAAIVLLCATGSACAFQPTTYGTGESVELGFIKDVTRMATLGAVGREEKARISYRERGELIVPANIEQAAIPQPLGEIDGVEDSFPGRGEEILREERAAEDKKTKGYVNPIVGNLSAQPVLHKNTDNEFARTEAQRELLTDPGDRSNQAFDQFGNSRADPEGARKTREDLAKELGVPVESLPKTLEERSLLERAGIVRPGSRSARTERLTDVPVEYRTVETTASGGAGTSDVDELVGNKKKKKKRFIFF